MPVAFHSAIPVIRSFDEDKARAFYLDYPGFTVDREHRFHEGLPRSMRSSNPANTHPGPETAPWGLEITVIDPFGNRL